MDIKDIKRAMDNMPMGDGSAFAEISVGPAKHCLLYTSDAADE